MAIALARRYRPKRFSDLLVQDHVATVLRGAIARNRVGHGYLLTGPRGVGKTTAARILAMALNCERKGQVEPAGEPCGECPSCLRVWNGSANLDVVEIDAASNRGVDDARELRERAMYAASQEGHHKVYIVDEAHMLTREAWNALLKILEEPPPGVVFVFATTEPHKIAQTAAPVMSRLQRFDFRRIGPAVIRERLKAVLAAEQIEAEDDALTLIARYADGGMRDALSVLDQCLSLGEGLVTGSRVREILGLVDDELYAEVLALVADRQPAGVFPLVDRLMEAGADLGEFIGGIAETLRALLMMQVGAEPEALTESLRQTLRELQDRLEPGDVLRMLRMISDIEGGVRRSGSARLLVETLLLRWTMLDRIVDLQQVLAGGPPATAPDGNLEPPRPPTPGALARPVVAGVAQPSAPTAPPRPVTAAVPAPAAPTPAGVPFTVEGLTGAWDDLVGAARVEGRFVGDALAGSRLLSVAPPVVTIALQSDNPMHSESLSRGREVVERVLGAAVGAPVQLRVDATPARAGVEGGTKPRRLNESEARAERLRVVKAKDPTLEAAAAELDLEIVE